MLFFRKTNLIGFPWAVFLYGKSQLAFRSSSENHSKSEISASIAVADIGAYDSDDVYISELVELENLKILYGILVIVNE